MAELNLKQQMSVPPPYLILPYQLKIGAITWQVREVPEAEIDCDSHTIGDQSESTQLIRIAQELSPEMKEEVLLHEVLHCINPQLSHSLVEMLAKSLHQVLSENRLFFEGGGEG